MQQIPKAKPLIGLTCRFDPAKDSYYLPVEYAEAVFQAGGIPVQIPLIPSSAAQAAEYLDAIVLSGSASDVDPARYGQPRHPAVTAVYPDRDETDFRLLDAAFREKKPVLGICFGIQSLNVYLGGSLVQHIPERVSGIINHDDTNTRHPVTLEPGSRLAAWVDGGAEIVVNSTHHQAIQALGDGLQIAGRSPDGVIEAVEGQFKGHFVAGVQWHPERIWASEPLSRRIFSELVIAAAAHKNLHVPAGVAEP
jgi:putative glutamine amidotransferase